MNKVNCLNRVRGGKKVNQQKVLGEPLDWLAGGDEDPSTASKKKRGGPTQRYTKWTLARESMDVAAVLCVATW